MTFLEEQQHFIKIGKNLTVMVRDAFPTVPELNGIVKELVDNRLANQVKAFNYERELIFLRRKILKLEFRENNKFIEDKNTNSKKLGRSYWEYTNTVKFGKVLDEAQVKIYLKYLESEQSLAKLEKFTDESTFDKGPITSIVYSYTVDSSD